MSKQNKSRFFFASCPRSLEEMLEKELIDNGITKTRIKNGGVQFETDELSGLKFVINTRLASRVYLEFHQFTLNREKDLYKDASKVSWDEVMDHNQTFKITTLVNKRALSTFTNPLHYSLVLKDSLADFFRDRDGSRPNVEKQNPDVSILMRIDQTGNRPGFWVSLYYDLSGIPLSNRGYRLPGHYAPLRENLAAALLYQMNYPEEKSDFCDSMCGSGTMLAEALLMLHDLPPSLLKIKNHSEETPAFDFFNHKWFYEDKDLKSKFENEMHHVMKKFKNIDVSDKIIFGQDSEGKNLAQTRESLELLFPLNKKVILNRGDSTKLVQPKDFKGIIFCNPPYGERLGEIEELTSLYYDYGENLKNNWKGQTAFVLTGNPELRKRISLQTSQRTPFYNGKIECRLLRYNLY
ncbi:THUMP domain-containing protein [Bacteriovoracaceae bacterium]|nr:THUMP domain-containing protein [Bacteriovoracaceae bacterium]